MARTAMAKAATTKNHTYFFTLHDLLYFWFSCAAFWGGLSSVSPAFCGPSFSQEAAGRICRFFTLSTPGPERKRHLRHGFIIYYEPEKGKFQGEEKLLSKSAAPQKPPAQPARTLFCPLGLPWNPFQAAKRGNGRTKKAR
jgi:hypothetical protein